MGVKRKKSFTAARIACKSCFKKTGLYPDEKINPQNISTLSINNSAPSITYKNTKIPFNCSVSHDNRFAIAVLSKKSIGIDIELISDKVLKSRHLYMSEEEINLADNFISGAIEGSLRIWSVKEAVSKASGLILTEAWQLVKITKININQTDFNFSNKKISAFHDYIDNHLLSAVII